MGGGRVGAGVTGGGGGSGASSSLSSFSFHRPISLST